MTNAPTDFSPTQPAPEHPSALSRLWSIAVHPVTFVVLTIFWCLDLGIGSVLAHNKDPKFWTRMDAYPFNVWLGKVAPKTFPESLWVYILTVLTFLMVASLVLCTCNWFLRRRKRMRGMAEVCVHLGFLLVFGGFFLGSGWGTREQNLTLASGDEVSLKTLPLALKLLDVRTVKDAEGNELDTVSRVALLDVTGTQLAEGDVRINHPLIHGSVVVYPQGSAGKTPVAVVRAEGIGDLKFAPGRAVPLPDGRSLVARGYLPPGQKFGEWAGPGLVLGLLGADGKPAGSAFLGTSPGMGAASLDGVELAFVDFSEEVMAAFHVHRDPGVWLVLVGAVILSLGTLWALAGYLGNTVPPAERTPPAAPPERKNGPPPEAAADDGSGEPPRNGLDSENKLG